MTAPSSMSAAARLSNLTPNADHLLAEEPESPYHHAGTTTHERHFYSSTLALADHSHHHHFRGARAGLRHEYLRDLLNSDSTVWTGFGTGKHALRGLSVPETAAVSSRPVAPLSARSVRRKTVGYRSLTEPVHTTMAAEDSMESVAVETAPSSPPELSYSKSSKSSSSSFRSSLDDESTEKLSHFEDITLDGPERESVEDSNLKPESRPTLRRPPPKTIKTGRESNGQTRLRDVTNGARRGYPSLHGAVDGAARDRSLNLPSGRGLRRNFTSPIPTSPSFMMQPPLRSSSRSPSPSKGFLMNGVPSSPHSVGGLTPKVSYDGSSPSGAGASGRRQSWQRGLRKTVKELEAEYDDLDEEVPEEAILQNVPITPMPGQPRTSREPSPQRQPSWTNLPHAHSTGAHSTLHSANVPRNAKRPSAPSKRPSGQIRSPRSPKHPRPRIPHSVTATAFPPEPFGKPQRSKSWTDDLNEEARQLSAALEEYADRSSTEKPSVPNSAGNSPPRPSLSAKGRATTSVVEMPPVQKGNIMIDPLPISKEKEAVLSRTRPSWLPPKCQKEEKKHMKEWEAMMARAQVVEKKRLSKQKEEDQHKTELDGSIARIWDQHVLPNWDRVIHEPRTRELWWRGVTPSSRGTVWAKAIGNDLQLSPSSFSAALARAQALETKLSSLPPEDRSKSKEAAWLAAIARDVPAAFPNIGAFTATNSGGSSALADVLKAYALYRSDVGYVYGTHLIAGMLCLYLPAAEAFLALANLLNRPTPLAFLVHDPAAMTRVHASVLATLAYKSPNLHAHLTSPALGLSPEEFLDPMFRCLFAYNLPPEHVARLWDLYVFEGDKLLVRAAVAVLGKLEPKLYGVRDEVLDLVSWRNEGRWDVGEGEEFVRSIREAGKVEGKRGSASSTP